MGLGRWFIGALALVAVAGCHGTDSYHCDRNPILACGRFRVIDTFGAGGTAAGGGGSGGAGGEGGASTGGGGSAGAGGM